MPELLPLCAGMRLAGALLLERASGHSRSYWTVTLACGCQSVVRGAQLGLYERRGRTLYCRAHHWSRRAYRPRRSEREQNGGGPCPECCDLPWRRPPYRKCVCGQPWYLETIVHCADPRRFDHVFA